MKDAEIVKLSQRCPRARVVLAELKACFLDHPLGRAAHPGT